VTIPSAAPGTYTLYVGNRGPQLESISYQVTLTTGAASITWRAQPQSLVSSRPYTGAVEPH
jgi:hypothetical protein